MKKQSRQRQQRQQQRAMKQRRRTGKPSAVRIEPRSAAEALWLRSHGGSRQDVEGLISQGMMYAYLGRVQDAERLYEEAQRRFPRDPRVRLGRSSIRMLAGDYRPQTWSDGVPGGPSGPREGKPAWQGESIPGQTLLVWEEWHKPGSGLGDLLMLARFVAWAKRQSQATVLLVVPAGMTRLLSSLPGADTLVEAPAPKDGFDRHIRLGFIPTVPGCEVTAANLWDGPYLQAEPEAIARWQPPRADHRLKVALHWQAQRSHLLDQERSLTLDELSPLFEIAGVQFISVQYGASQEVKAYPQCVDSSISHLAGALGGPPVWIILDQFHDPRWGLQRRQTPWYPTTHRLYRAPQLGDLECAMWEIRDDLERLVERRRQTPVTV